MNAGDSQSGNLGTCVEDQATGSLTAPQMKSKDGLSVLERKRTNELQMNKSSVYKEMTLNTKQVWQSGTKR